MLGVVSTPTTIYRMISLLDQNDTLAGFLPLKLFIPSELLNSMYGSLAEWSTVGGDIPEVWIRKGKDEERVLGLPHPMELYPSCSLSASVMHMREEDWAKSSRPPLSTH
jgi:hypothetical protein